MSNDDNHKKKIVIGSWPIIVIEKQLTKVDRWTITIKQLTKLSQQQSQKNDEQKLIGNALEKMVKENWPMMVVEGWLVKIAESVGRFVLYKLERLTLNS